MIKKRKKSYAVVTGASSGIGMEFARRLVAEGYNIILSGRRSDRLNQLSDELKVTGADIIVIEADLSKIDNCKVFMSKILKYKISVFINNAGFGDCGYFMDTDVNKELLMIDVNIKAVHFLTKTMLLKMDMQGGGYILNVASSAGLIPAGPYMATYYATKSYVTSLTRAIARELEEHDSPIYIGCLCPGPVDTEFNQVANVEFALKGISASYCVDYAIAQMKKRQTVIIPTLRMKMLSVCGRFIPQKIYINLTGRQQKKKLGVDADALMR